MPQSMIEKHSVAAESTAKPTANPFSEAIALMDDDSWVWNLVKSSLEQLNINATKLASSTSLRHSWNRFQKMPFLILHWENKLRFGGAVIEEILDIDRNFDVAEKVIVVTTNPIHEDIVSFSELGIRRVIRPRQRDAELRQSMNELISHINSIMSPPQKHTAESLWRKIISALDRLPDNPQETILQKIEAHIIKLRQPGKALSARDLEAEALVYLKRNQLETAEKLFNQAISVNPNYFRAWNGLIQTKTKQNLHEDAYHLMQKMQLQNRNSISRLVAMGESQLALHDIRKAEHYFKSALDKDGWNSGALNGLAEIKFSDNELDEARTLLSKSNVAYRYATKLNMIGINLVNSGKYEIALEHYSKAQYVLPHQEKGPQLLYNIALCYAKWGRAPMAEEFLKLALVKEPNYKKATRLLEQVRKIANANQQTVQSIKGSSTGFAA